MLSRAGDHAMCPLPPTQRKRKEKTKQTIFDLARRRRPKRCSRPFRVRMFEACQFVGAPSSRGAATGRQGLHCTSVARPGRSLHSLHSRFVAHPMVVAWTVAAPQRRKPRPRRNPCSPRKSGVGIGKTLLFLFREFTESYATSSGPKCPSCPDTYITYVTSTQQAALLNMRAFRPVCAHATQTLQTPQLSQGVTVPRLARRGLSRPAVAPPWPCFSRPVGCYPL